MDKQVKILERNNSKHWADIAREMLLNIWHDGDKPVKITVEDYSETRRDAQNRLLWRWHGEYAKHRYECAGEVFSSEQWHDKMVPEFLPSEPVKIKGKWHIPRVETKKLNVGVFADFLTRYEVEAAHDNCVFSRPNDLYFKAVMKDD